MGCRGAANSALRVENPALSPGAWFVDARNLDRIGTVSKEEHSIVPPKGVDHRIAKANVESKADTDKIPHPKIAQQRIEAGVEESAMNVLPDVIVPFPGSDHVGIREDIGGTNVVLERVDVSLGIDFIFDDVKLLPLLLAVS